MPAAPVLSAPQTSQPAQQLSLDGKRGPEHQGSCRQLQRSAASSHRGRSKACLGQLLWPSQLLRLLVRDRKLLLTGCRLPSVCLHSPSGQLQSSGAYTAGGSSQPLFCFFAKTSLPLLHMLTPTSCLPSQFMTARGYSFCKCLPQHILCACLSRANGLCVRAVLACFYLLFVGLLVSVVVSIWVGMSFS
jgi:hypothetical protein